MPSPITRRPRWRHARAALSAVWIAGAVPLLSGWVVPSEAHAATARNSPAPDLNASARAEVAQALYSASATSAAAERAADAKLTQQRRQIEQLQAQLKTAGGRNATLLADLTRAQERFVEQLAERDRAYAQSIAVFRWAVQDIAATPEGEAALRQFNAGDEAGALAVLDRMVDARERARKVQADIETAVERRRVATLALEAMGKGKQQEADVIRRFEEVTRLDPGLHWDWVELARLYRAAGRLPVARRASLRAAETADSDRDQVIAWSELAGVLVAQGDLPGAREKYQKATDLLKKQAEADPSSASLQRDLSVIFNNLGDVLVAQGDLPGATAQILKGLEIRKKLAMTYPFPLSASLERDLIDSYVKLGDLRLEQGDLLGARAWFQQGLAIRTKLVTGDPSSVPLQRDLIDSYVKLGDVLVEQGDLQGADALFQKGLEIAKKLAAADPSSASLQRNLSVIFNLLGEVLVAQGDLPAARARFQEGLEIAKKLAAADPSSASRQRDLIVSYVKLSEGFKDRWYAQQALDVALAMQQRGILAPRDAWMVEDLKRRAGP